jgi:hypothetical protein
LFDAFNNATASYTCQSSGPYSPGLIDPRRLVMQFNDGSAAGWQTLPPMDINSVPYAMFSEDSEKLQSHPATDFVLGSALPTCGGGEYLKYNGTIFTCATPAGAGSIGSVTSTNSYLTVTNGTSTPALTVNVGTLANTVAAGDDARITGAFQSATALSGDLTGTLPNAVVKSLAITDAKIKDVAFSKITGKPTTLSGYGIVATSSDTTTSLGYTPVNRAGDTMTGTLVLPSNGLQVGSNLIVSGNNVGIGTTSPSSAFQVTSDVATLPTTGFYGQFEITGKATTSPAMRLSMGVLGTNSYVHLY